MSSLHPRSGSSGCSCLDFIFHIDRHGDHCKIASRIHIRIGPLAKRLNQKEFDAVRQHMRDEGQNLKRLLEGSH